MIKEEKKKDKMEIGMPFSSRFIIKNIGKDWPKNVEIVDSDTKEGKKLTSLKKGEDMVVELGPFVCENETFLEKTYYLCYKQYDQFVRFGYKFGFGVKGVKKIEVKTLKVNTRDRIRDLKMISGSTKS